MNLLKIAAWIFFDKVFLVLLSIFSFYAFAKYLTPEELGVGVLYVAVPALVASLFSGMIESPLVSKAEVSKDEYSSTFWFAIGLGTILGLVCLAIGALFTPEEHWYLLLLSSSSIVFVLASRPFLAKLRRAHDFKSIALRALIAKCLSFFACIYLAVNGYGPVAIVTQYLVQELVSFVAMAVMAREVLALRFKLNLVANTLKMGCYVSITSLSNTLMTNGLTLALGSVAGAYSVGLYNFANRIVSLPSDAIFNGLCSYALPALAKHQDNKASLKENYRKLFKFAMLLIFPCFVGLMLISNQLVSIIFGQEWLESVVYLQLFALIAIVRALYIFNSSIFLILGVPNVITKKEIVSSVVCFSLVFILGAELEVGSAVLATTLYAVSILFWGYLALRKVLDYSVYDFFVDVKTPCLSVIFMGLCLVGYEKYYVFSEQSWEMLVSLISVGMVSYLLSVVMFEHKLFFKTYSRFKYSSK